VVGPNTTNTFSLSSSESFFLLYISLVRTEHEYFSVAYNSLTNTDCNKPEGDMKLFNSDLQHNTGIQFSSTIGELVPLWLANQKRGKCDYTSEPKYSQKSLRPNKLKTIRNI
jgi:hypothetical protein